MVHHTPKPATLTPPPPHTAHTDFAKHTGVDRTMNGALGREEDGREACANCDKHESDIVKLKNCTDRLFSRQILQRGLPEGTSEAAQEGMQATCSRAQGRATVQPGSRETGMQLLPDMYSAYSTPNG